MQTVWADNDCYIDIRLAVDDTVAILPKNPVMLGDVSLWSLRALRYVVIPDGTKIIGSYWFENSSIESITIPASVGTLGTEAFYNYKNLKRVDVEPKSGLSRIEEKCFCGSGLESITFPRRLYIVINNAFKDCENLTTIRLEGKISVRGLRSSVPLSAKFAHSPTTMIGKLRVSDLYNLKDVAIPDGIEIIEEYLFFHSEIEIVRIPASVKTIGKEAFYGSQKLRQVIFAEGSNLEKMESYCFSQCGLEAVEIPSSVKLLESGVFNCCNKLKSVQFAEGS